MYVIPIKYPGRTSRRGAAPKVGAAGGGAAQECGAGRNLHGALTWCSGSRAALRRAVSRQIASCLSNALP